MCLFLDYFIDNAMGKAIELCIRLWEYSVVRPLAFMRAHLRFFVGVAQICAGGYIVHGLVYVTEDAIAKVFWAALMPPM